MAYSVEFENQTTETVTFILETSNGPRTAFTLNPTPALSHLEKGSTSLSHEQLRLKVGDNYTNECVSTDELAGLKTVVVTKEEPGNNFVLVKHPRSLEGPSSLWNRFSNRLFGSRNEGPARV